MKTEIDGKTVVISPWSVGYTIWKKRAAGPPRNTVPPVMAVQ